MHRQSGERNPPLRLSKNTKCFGGNLSGNRKSCPKEK
nr:MAG TPA: hypothetical protein [Caudoviricetes sp.]